MDRIDLRCILDEGNVIVEADSPSGICACQSSVGNDFLAAITEPNLCELYRMVITRVRTSGRALTFDFRCDTADLKRDSYVRIGAIRDGNRLFVEVLNGTRKETPHATRVQLLDPAAPRGTDFLMVCSWCKQVKLSDERWVEIEEAMHELKLLQRAEMPALSHGLCRTCAERVMADFIRQLDDASTTIG